MQAKKIIDTLFEDNRDAEWSKLRQISATTTPSNSIKDFDHNYTCEYRNILRDRFQSTFDDHAHGDTSWEELVFQIRRASGIRSFSYRRKVYEEQIVTSGIYPMLRKIVDAILVLPGRRWNSSNNSFSAHFIVREAVNASTRDTHSAFTDAAIQINDGDHKCRAYIPIEAKVKAKCDDFSQLAAYITKTSTAEEIRDKVMIGILIDKEQLHLAFSPLKYEDKSITPARTVPLPVVYVSPSIQWKSLESDSVFSTLNPAALLIIACTCFFDMERIVVPEDHDDLSVSLLDIGEKILQNEPHKFSAIQHEYDEILKNQEKQKQELKAQREEIKMLRKKLEDKEDHQREEIRKIKETVEELKTSSCSSSLDISDTNTESNSLDSVAKPSPKKFREDNS